MHTQVSINTKLNYFSRRFGAGFIDGVVIILFGMVLFGYSTLLNNIIPIHQYMGESYLLRHFVSFFTMTVPTILYFVMMEKENNGASMGKKLSGLKVETEDGTVPKVSSLWIRNGVKFLPWEIAHTTLNIYPEFLLTGEITGAGLYVGYGFSYLLSFIYLGMILFRKDKRSFYEILSNTAVVRNAPL